jgi:hypothetical protein
LSDPVAHQWAKLPKAPTSLLPLDHLEVPRLLRTTDAEPNKEPNK